MVRKLTIFAVLAGCVFLAANVQGATISVSSMAELQSALVAAGSNGQDDTINVAAGHYTVSATFSYVAAEQYSITVTGAGRGQTILDGGGANQIMTLDTSQADIDHGTSVMISGISFVNGNKAGGNGGGLEILTNLADVIVENCEFNGNEATPPDPGPPPWPARGPGGGGGLYVAVGVTESVDFPTSAGNVFVANSLFRANRSTNGAGAFIHAAARIYPITQFANNILEGNMASVNGGGVWVESDYLFFLNNTIPNNSSVEYGGGFYLYGATLRINIFNNIIWGNSAEEDGADIYLYDGGTPEYIKIFNNCYLSLVLKYGYSYSEGQNSNEAPNLDANYNLQLGTNCIDSGDNSAPNLPSTDFDGNQRIQNGTVDRGAKEFGSTGIPDSPPDPPGDSPAGGGGGCFIDAIMGWAL
jgi:hypothetical protein